MAQIEELLAELVEAIHARGAVPEQVLIGLEVFRGAMDRWLSGASGALCAPKHGRWLVSPSGVHLDLERRPTLRRIVGALLEARVARPGESVASATLIVAGWSDEVASPEASANRLRVALCRLRQLGLEGVIVTTSSGWMLDPSIPVVRESEPPPSIEEVGAPVDERGSSSMISEI